MTRTINRAGMAAVALLASTAIAAANSVYQVPLSSVGSPATVISTGSIAADVLGWVVSIASIPLASIATALLYRVFQRAGFQLTNDMRARLQAIIVNGINVSAAEAEKSMAGKGAIEVKNHVVAAAVSYAQAHASDTIKALGLDPVSRDAVEAIKAHIETALLDPKTPTPPAISPAPTSIAGRETASPIAG